MLAVAYKWRWKNGRLGNKGKELAALAKKGHRLAALPVTY